MARSKLPPHASSRTLATSRDAPVTEINCSNFVTSIIIPSSTNVGEQQLEISLLYHSHVPRWVGLYSLSPRPNFSRAPCGPGGRGQKFGPGTQRSRQLSKKVFPCLLWLQFSTACKFLYTFDHFCMLQAIKCEGGLGTIARLDRCWCAIRSNGSLMSSKTIRLYKTLEMLRSVHK